MKLLVVDVNYDYKNSMYRTFYNYLSAVAEVDFFGPGYVERKVLSKGIIDYVSKRGAYDAILIGIYFIYSGAKVRLRFNAYEIHRNVLSYYNVNDAYQCCGKILEDLDKLHSTIKIINYYEDAVNMPLQDYRYCLQLVEKGYYIMSWPVEYMQVYDRKTVLQHQVLTNYAYQLIKECKNYYIPIPIQAISYHELFFDIYENRKYEWCIPGNRNELYYPERNKLFKEIKRQGYRMWEKDPYQKLSLSKIENNHMNWYQFRNKSEAIISFFVKKVSYISSKPKMTYIAACRELYLESLRQTKNIFNDGGIGKIFVRKYYETCANGALMVCTNIPGLEEMGFQHDKNCIIVNDMNIQKAIEEIRSNPIKMGKVARAGQKLIIEKHMFTNRVGDLCKTILAIEEKKYNGAKWQDGNYILL